MKTLGNIIWFLFGGLIGGLLWLIAGCLWCITIIGIPVGVQCFKFIGLSMWPFGKKVVYDDSAISLLVNILWIALSGLELAAFYLVIGLIYCITIIGIPFGKQCFKLAKLALMPFGAAVQQAE